MSPLTFLFVAFLSLNLVKSCVLPPPPPPVWTIFDSVDVNGVIYYWVGVEVDLFEIDVLTTCTCGFGLPPSVPSIIREAKLSYIQDNNHSREEIIIRSFTWEADNCTNGTNDNINVDPDEFDMKTFSAEVDPQRLEAERENIPEGYILKIWFLVCFLDGIPIRGIPVKFGAGALAEGEPPCGNFSEDHPFKCWDLGPAPHIFEDPVVNTFDGAVFEYQGLCSYLLTQDCDQNYNGLKEYEQFKIISSNAPCDIGTCLDSVVVYLKDDEKITRVQFSKGSLLLDDKQIDEDSWDSYHHPLFNLSLVRRTYGESRRLGVIDVNNLPMYMNVLEEYVRMDTIYGVSLEWNNIDQMRFDLSSYKFEKNLCGILGNGDGIKQNDIRLRNGTLIDYVHIEEDNERVIQRFVHDWLERQPHDPENCKSEGLRQNCDNNLERKILATSICDGFVKSMRYNLDCSINDLQGIHKRCIKDLCYCYNEDLFSCARFLHKWYHSHCGKNSPHLA